MTTDFIRCGGARVINGSGNHRWISGEIGNCVMQRHSVVSRLGSHAIYVRPYDDRSPIYRILEVLNIAVPRTRGNGLILIGYTGDFDGDTCRGELVNGIPIEIAKRSSIGPNDWQFDVFIDRATQGSEEFLIACGAAGRDVPLPDETQRRLGVGRYKAA